MAVVCEPATVMVRPLLHWITYDAGAPLPLGASHARVTVQSVTPATRRFFGADTDCANAALELPRGASPSRKATMQVECKTRFRRADMVGPRCRKEHDGWPGIANTVPHFAC